MRIGLMVNRGLNQAFRQKDENIFLTLCSLDDIEKDIDALVIEDQYVSINILLKHMDQYQEHMKCFYILSEHTSLNHNALLKNRNITPIPFTFTKEQTVAKVLNTVKEKDEKVKDNIIVFFGADNKVGTSMVTQSVAEAISQNTNTKVLLAVLDGNPDIDYISGVNDDFSIDTIRAKVLNHMLSNNELLDICIKVEQLYILPGTKSFVHRKYYHPDHIEALLHQLSEVFDIIIVDAGSNAELGMTLGALNSTAYRFLVGTQQPTCLKHFEQVNAQILDPLNINNFLLIINKYIESSLIFDSYQLSEAYEMPYICTIPYSEYGIQAELEQCTLQKYRESNYSESIRMITGLIEDSLDIPYIEKKKPKSFLKKVFKRRRQKGK